MPRNEGFNGLPPARLPKLKALNAECVKRDVIVIGASAGGVMALRNLFASLPARLPAVVGVVLHRGPGPSELVDVLGRRSSLPVIEPEEAMALKQGTIYLAPPDHHLLFEPRRLAVQRGPKEHSTRPAIDPLFRSAAARYGPRVVGILLTGCGEDGVSGLIAISSAAGLTLAQDPDEADMPYMPLNALRQDDVDGVFRLGELAKAVGALANGWEISASRSTGR